MWVSEAQELELEPSVVRSRSALRELWADGKKASRLPIRGDLFDGEDVFRDFLGEEPTIVGRIVLRTVFGKLTG